MSGGFWESRGTPPCGGVEKGRKKESKGKRNKDDGRNSNASLEQCESISVFVLLSPGSLNSQGEGSPVLNLRVCASIQRVFCACSRVCVARRRERALADVCTLAGWRVFAFESTSMRACTKGDASLCTHTVAFFHHTVV